MGHALAREFVGSRFKRFSGRTGFVNNGPYRMILGVLCVLIGLINLFPVRAGEIAVLGNLLPSLTGIVGGVLLLSEYARSRKSTEKKDKISEIAEEVEKISSPYLNIFGIGSIIIGVLHAVFPKVPLL